MPTRSPRNGISIGEWPKFADGKLTPFMELLLSRQPVMSAVLGEIARSRSARSNESDAGAIGRRGAIRLGREDACFSIWSWRGSRI